MFVCEGISDDKDDKDKCEETTADTYRKRLGAVALISHAPYNWKNYLALMLFNIEFVTSKSYKHLVTFMYWLW